MKIIKLFLLLSLMLCAEFKLDIPQDINVSQLENIVKNGWSEDNKTLNNLIVSNAERVMPEILEKIKKPLLKDVVTKDEYLSTPKINLRREDYFFIVSYTKYLEFNNDIDKSLELNIKILKGLKNVDDTSMLSVIYSLVVEQTVRDGLTQLLSKSKNFNNKSILVKELSNLLTLDTSTFFKAMEKEQKFLPKVWDESAYQEFVVKEYGINYPNLMMDISKKIKIYNDLFYNKMFDAMKKETPEAMDVWEQEIDKMRKEHTNNINSIHFLVSSLWVKMQSLVGIEVKDFGYVSQYLAYNLVYVAMPKLALIYKDYLNHIQKNKVFLEKLKNYK